MRFVFVVLILLLFSPGAICQTKEKTASVKFLLVELKSEKNKLDYFNAHKNPTELKHLSDDIAAQNLATINDYTDHFNYCPVYFYMDTNRQKIKDKQFEGYLFKGGYTILPANTIPDNETRFMVVKYGHPDDSLSIFQNTMGLIMYNYKLEPLQFIKKIRGKIPKQYYFTSKKYNIEYRPFATQLNNSFLNNYKKDTTGAEMNH